MLGSCGRFHWLKGSNRQSNSTVEWYIPPSAASGFYRIKHFGHNKQMKGLRPVITSYEGTSDVFSVTRSFYSRQYDELRMQKREKMSHYWCDVIGRWNFEKSVSLFLKKTMWSSVSNWFQSISTRGKNQPLQYKSCIWSVIFVCLWHQVNFHPDEMHLRVMNYW